MDKNPLKFRGHREGDPKNDKTEEKTKTKQEFVKKRKSRSGKDMKVKPLRECSHLGKK